MPAHRHHPRRAVLLALPAAAHAATAEVQSGQLVYRGGAAGNAVSLSQLADGRLLVSDSRDAVSAGAGCATVSGGAVCSGASRIFVGLGGGDDVLSSTTSLPTTYNGGLGDDVLVSGTGPSTSKVAFNGNDGRDTANYAGAARGVTVRKDGADNDGRTGLDADHIEADVEVLQGSEFADTLSSFDAPTRFAGLGGADTLSGGSANDVFEAGAQADGADVIRGNGGFDTVDYRARTRSVTITVDAAGADDGEAGEGDEVRTTEQALTGSGADTLAGSPIATRGGSCVSGAGIDRITGTDEADGITPGTGRDIVDARGGADVVRARDGEADSVACGLGPDTLEADAADVLVTGCEAAG
jgi:hypothetical protein